MESLWELAYLLEPASLVLIFTAVMVVYSSAQRALNYEREMERHRDLADAAITLDSSQALMIPVASSCSLLLMFYLFASMSQIIMAFTAIASASSFAFCLAPHVASISSHFGFTDPTVMRCCWWQLSRSQVLLAVMSVGVVGAWLISGHWLLNNILGISICIAFVSHVRLPNIKICALLLACLFVYDIFWVFFSEHFFGANVMVSVAMQQASNPVHTVANTLKLPGFQAITKKLELPVKLVFPRNLFGGTMPSGTSTEFMMLGLGDMAIPGMLLALVLCFDYRKSKDCSSDLNPPVKGQKYLWCAIWGYAAGLIAALAAGVLMRAPQPALLYLDCSAGACERNWSSYSLIHTKIRNRLSTSQLEKLVYCRANMRLVRSYHALGSPKQVDPTLLKMVDDPSPEEVDRQIRDEQEDILRDLHRELESVDRRVTRSRARALSIPLRPAVPDTDSARRESIRREKLPVRTKRRRANEAIRLFHTEVSDPEEEDAPDNVPSVTTVDPDFDDEGNALDDGGMLSSDDTSSSSDDEL